MELFNYSYCIKDIKEVGSLCQHKEVADGKNIKYCSEVAHIKPDKFRRLADKQDRLVDT